LHSTGERTIWLGLITNYTSVEETAGKPAQLTDHTWANNKKCTPAPSPTIRVLMPPKSGVLRFTGPCRGPTRLRAVSPDESPVLEVVIETAIGQVACALMRFVQKNEVICAQAEAVKIAPRRAEPGVPRI
jgi:hypothetical protein